MKTLKRITICTITSPFMLLAMVIYAAVWVVKNTRWAWGGDDNEWDGKP